MRTYGSQSLVAPLKRVMVKRPTENAADAARWREFGYLHAPDAERLRAEHAAFVALVAASGAEVLYEDEIVPVPTELLDAIFVYDPAIVTDAGAIIGQPGKPLRRGEDEAMRRAFGEIGVPILGVVGGEATMDGGDTLWLDHETLCVGLSYRTNDAAIVQLRDLLAPLGVTVIPFPLPHWRGPAECLHLMSLISPVAEDLAVVYPPLMPIPLMRLLEERGIRQVVVPDAEFPTLGCNVLAVAPREVIMAAGNPATSAALRAAGCTVREYAGAEISLNREGGPTCLTRPILRSNEQ
ncbi:MAG: arginine deiminase family protein [Chloroflexota bacterium]|nr:arginine deiminase family protein [Chloroflexota bacterium]